MLQELKSREQMEQTMEEIRLTALASGTG